MDEKPVDEVMTWHLFCDILTGLDHIHENGFIHLDIKVTRPEKWRGGRVEVSQS